MKKFTWKKPAAVICCAALVAVAIFAFANAPKSTNLDANENLVASEQQQYSGSASQYSQESYDALKSVISVNYQGKDVKLEDLDAQKYTGFMFKPDEAAQGYSALQIKLKAACKANKIQALSGGAYVSESLDTIAALANADQLEYVEPDYVVTLADVDYESTSSSLADSKVSIQGGTSQNPAPDWPPTDPKYISGDLWNLDMLEVNKAWELGLDGDSYVLNKKALHDGDVKVAVIDSGLYGTGNGQDKHEDINYDNVIVGANCVSDADGTPDTLGHGTFVSGLIAAKANNGVGVTGAMPGVTIVTEKVFESKSGSTSDIVDAIYDATDKQKVDVINMSLGGESNAATLKTACEHAANQGILVVASAGNDGVSTPNYPAAYDCVVGVASVDKNKQRSTWSQYGKSVFVTAPGEDVTSTYCESATSYKTASGTSFSGPEVAALAAMCKSIYPEMNQDIFMEFLINTSTDLGSKGYDDYYGYGLVSYSKMAQALMESQALAWYKVSFEVTDQDGKAISPDSIVVTAAEDISWEADPSSGIDADGTWKKGTVIKANDDGSYSLHKGNYSYSIVCDGKYTAQSIFKTYAEKQTVSVVMDDAQEVKLTPMHSDDSIATAASVKITSAGGRAEVAKSASGGTQTFDLCSGTYSFSITENGYEQSAGSFVVQRAGLQLKPVLYKSEQLCSVSFNCINDDDNTAITSGLGIAVYNSSNMSISASDDGSFRLARGKTYKVVITKLGYEDKAFDFTVDDAASQTIEARMIKAECSITFNAIDEDGNAINDASVQVTNSAGTVMNPSVRNAMRYNLKQGTYSYKLSADGYTQATGTFGVSLESLTLNITLKAVPNKLSFNIVGEDGQAISDASVKVMTSTSLTAIAADEDGTYSLVKGSYRYVIYKEGYASVRDSFEMAAQDKIIDVVLKPATEPQGAYQGGSGTAQDPYQIATEDQLRYLAAQTTIERVAKTDAATNKKGEVTGYYELIADINLTKAWTPIGNYENSSNYVAFAGHFDGMGHTISGINVEGEESGALIDAQGFFGYVKSATILNLTVEGCVTGDEYVGGIVGRAYYAYDEKYSDWNTDATLIKGCKNKVSVYGRYAVGGIVGSSQGAIDSSDIGIPTTTLGIKISECANYGSIYASKNGEFSRNASAAGGIVGSDQRTQIDHCYSKGNVKAGFKAGGIAGNLNACKVANSYAAASVNIYASGTGYENTGAGVAGYIYNTSITDSYSLKDAKSTSSAAIGYSGSSETVQVFALERSKMYRNSEFLTAINTDSVNSEVGTSFIDGNDYPVLSWEYASGTVFAPTPYIEVEPIGNTEDESYKLGTEIPALTAKAETPQSGQISWQWYGYKLSDNSAEEEIEGASGSGTQASFVPSIAEAGIYAYRVVFTNTLTSGGKTNSASTSSEYAYVYVRSAIDAQAPSITALNPSQTSKFNTELSVKETTDLELSVEASSSDGGTLSYQWYTSGTGTGSGKAIGGATSAQYNVDTNSAGTFYYCVKVTNKTEPGNKASVLSDWIKVEVKAYTISSYEELVSFRSAVNSGKDFYGHTVTLTADIAIPDGVKWVPIGTYKHPFAGTFMGGVGASGSKTITTHTISGLYIDGDANGNCYQGLFGVICDASVYDLKVSGQLRGAGNVYAGLIVGLAMSGNNSSNPCEIANCSALDGSYAEGKYYLGGIVGYGYANMVDCANHAQIVGCAFEPNSSEAGSGYSFNSYVWSVGGVIGADAYGYVRGCYNSGAVSVQEISSSQKCAIYAGGVMGYCTTYAEIESCYNSGKLEIGTKASKKLENGVLYAGSVAGYVSYEQYANLHYLENSYSCGVNVSSGTDYTEYHSAAFMKSDFFVSQLNDGTYASNFASTKYGMPRLAWEEDTTTDDGVVAPAEAYIDDITLADDPDLTSTWSTYYYKGESPSPVHVLAYAVCDGAFTARWQSRAVGAADDAWQDVEGSSQTLTPDDKGAIDATYKFSTADEGSLEYRCVIRTTVEGATVSPNYIEVETPTITVEIRNNEGVFGLKDPSQANSKSNPWVIKTAKQLQMLSQLVSGEAKLVGLSDSTFSGQYVSLDADIDLSVLGGSFSPIGNYTLGKAFAGCFMGNNHVISGLSIKYSSDDAQTSSEYQALFGYLSGAYVKDLEVHGTVDIGVNGAFATGGIVAYSYTTVLENLSNYVDVTGDSRVGGVVGYALRTVLYDCENMGNISTVASDSAGSGFSGYDVGGVVGSLVNGLNDGYAIGIYNCYNGGKVTGCLSSGDMRMGAVVGSRTGTSVIPVISNSYYAKGSAVCKDESSFVPAGCGQSMAYPEEDAAGVIESIDDTASRAIAWSLNSAGGSKANSGLWGVYSNEASAQSESSIHLVHAKSECAIYHVDVKNIAADIAVSNEYPVRGEQVKVDFTDKPGFVLKSLKYKLSDSDDAESTGTEISTGESFEMPAGDICFAAEYEQDLSREYSLEVKPMLYGGGAVDENAASATLQLPGGTVVSTAKQGQNLVAKLKIDSAYQIKSLVVEDAYSTPVQAKRIDGLTYNFTMPAANTIVKIVLEKAGSAASSYAASLEVNKEAVHKMCSDSSWQTGTYLEKCVVFSGSVFGAGANNIKTLSELESFTKPGLYEQEYSFADGSTHRYTGFNAKLLLERLGVPANASASTQVIFESTDGSVFRCTWGDICALTYNAYDSTAQPITRGLPVLLSVGADGNPNKDGLNLVFGQTSADDDNEAKMLCGISRIVVGNDINYSQHVWSPYNDFANLGGSTSIKIRIYSGSKLVGTKTYSIADIEKWANADKSGIQRGNFATAIYENKDAIDDYSGPYADYYEGFDLSKVFEKLGMMKVDSNALHGTSVQFFQNSGYADSWKTVSVSADYILGADASGNFGLYDDYYSYASESSQSAAFKQNGTRPMIAYGKNGYPLVLYSGSNGMVQTAYNYRGPLIAILPQSELNGGDYATDKTCAACYLSDIEIQLPEGTYYDSSWAEDGAADDGNNDDKGNVTPAKDTRLNAGKIIRHGNLVYTVLKGKKTVSVKAYAKAKGKINKLNVKSSIKDAKGNVYKVTQIAKKGFKGCKKLTKVSGGKQLVKIGASAFSGCKKLKNFTCTSKVLKTIGSKAFYKTSKLTKVTIKKTIKLKTVTKAFKKAGKNGGKKLVVKVKSSKKKAYKKLILKKGKNKKLIVK